MFVMPCVLHRVRERPHMAGEYVPGNKQPHAKIIAEKILHKLP